MICDNTNNDPNTTLVKPLISAHHLHSNEVSSMNNINSTKTSGSPPHGYDDDRSSYTNRRGYSSGRRRPYIRRRRPAGRQLQQHIHRVGTKKERGYINHYSDSFVNLYSELTINDKGKTGPAKEENEIKCIPISRSSSSSSSSDSDDNSNSVEKFCFHRNISSIKHCSVCGLTSGKDDDDENHKWIRINSEPYSDV